MTEAAVITALSGPDPVNPIAGEVAGLIDGYTANFPANVERLGYMPAMILRANVACPIEAVAIG